MFGGRGMSVRHSAIFSRRRPALDMAGGTRDANPIPTLDALGTEIFRS
jgi:hypothetical protein